MSGYAMTRVATRLILSDGTVLDIGAVADGEFLKRDGAMVTSAAVAGGSVTAIAPASVAIDATATGATTIYTVPTGYKFIMTGRSWVDTVNDGDGVAHTAQWGKSTDADFVAAAALVDTGTAGIHRTTGPTRVFTAGEVIQIDITVAATHTTSTGFAAIEGFLLDV